MPNARVPAAAPGLPKPKYDRAAIMRAAWAHYRSIREHYALWQIARGHVDGSFSTALKRAWREAKAAAVRTVDPVRLTQLRAELSSLEMQDSFLASTNHRMHAVRSEMSQHAA